MMNRREFLKMSSALSLCSVLPVASTEAGKKKDFLLSFDGGNGDYAKMSQAFNLANQISNITGERAGFTFFMTSALYFPKQKRNSDVGWGENSREIEKRISLTQEAIDLNHEIGSHSVGHLHGGNWNKRQWYDELNEFDSHMRFLFRDNNGVPYKSKGFRAPYLEWSQGMFGALNDLGYVYDSSPVGNSIVKRREIPSVELPLWTRPDGRRVLSMDYNWMVSKVTTQELEFMLENESRKRNPFFVSMHFPDYPGNGKPYHETVFDFVRKCARSGQFKFPTMLDYVNNWAKQAKFK